MFNTRIIERLRSDDRGLGLIEIVIAMFLLALLALSLAPLLIQGMQATVRNATFAAATQLVTEGMSLARAGGPICADVQATAGVRTLTDARGVDLEATTTVGACPAGGTGTVSVTVTAVRLDTAETVAEAATLVFVDS
jgi:Tfp pilus assembly protein PilV